MVYPACPERTWVELVEPVEGSHAEAQSIHFSPSFDKNHCFIGLLAIQLPLPMKAFKELKNEVARLAPDGTF